MFCTTVNNMVNSWRRHLSIIVTRTFVISMECVWSSTSGMEDNTLFKRDNKKFVEVASLLVVLENEWIVFKTSNLFISFCNDFIFCKPCSLAFRICCVLNTTETSELVNPVESPFRLFSSSWLPLFTLP